jgi:hypothetical protein
LKRWPEAKASDHTAEIALIGESNYGREKKLACKNSRGREKRNGEKSPLHATHQTCHAPK